MHLWGFIDIEPCNCLSVSFEIPYCHMVDFVALDACHLLVTSL